MYLNHIKKISKCLTLRNAIIRNFSPIKSLLSPSLLFVFSKLSHILNNSLNKIRMSCGLRYKFMSTKSMGFGALKLHRHSTDLSSVANTGCTFRRPILTDEEIHLLNFDNLIRRRHNQNTIILAKFKSTPSVTSVGSFVMKVSSQVEEMFKLIREEMIKRGLLEETRQRDMRERIRQK